VAILSGIIITAPVWLYQLWAFIAPALHRKEKRNSILFFIAATPFFAIGAFLGYSVLPIAVKVLFGFTPNSLTNLVKFDDYLDFVLRVILLFGIAFELPVFLVTFNAIGFLSGKTILRPGESGYSVSVSSSLGLLRAQIHCQCLHLQHHSLRSIFWLELLRSSMIRDEQNEAKHLNL
jgi:Tat protein translocase TatC